MYRAMSKFVKIKNDVNRILSQENSALIPLCIPKGILWLKKVLREPTERQVKSDRLWKLDKTRVVLVTVLDYILLDYFFIIYISK